MTDQLPAEIRDDQPNSLAQMFATLVELARDQDVSADKLTTLVEVQERMIDRQAMKDFNAAKLAAQREMPSITMDGAIKNKAGQVQSRYARFENIDRIVRPICEKHGLSYSFDLTQMGQQMGVTCIVSHTGGHVERYGPMPLAIDTTGAKNATQGAGSAASYGKRYTLCAAFNIVTEGEDDDGRSSGRGGGGVSEWQEETLAAARQAATGGSAAYKKWFEGQSAMARGYLIDAGEHEALKAAAEEHGK